jgi:hypothetical protein
MRRHFFILAVILSFVSIPLLSKDDTTYRYAISIGANYGGPGRDVLRFAVTDARAFLRIMEQLGGVKPKHSTLLVEPSASMVMNEITKARELIIKNKKKGERSEIIVYYSGHSDEEGLLLGRDKILYRDLRKQIDELPGDVKIAILDSCSSGAFTRIKGGKMLSPFMSDPSYDMKGYAFLTSSSSDEVSQESEKIKGSFFTHYLLSGLRGAADMTQDGRITLTEAYQYAYRETLLRTEKTSGGAQHPNYQIQMSGTGDVILTDIRKNHSMLTFSEQVSGRIYINTDSTVVAEVSKETGERLSIALDEGMYTLIQERQGDIFESRVALRKGNQTTISSNSFSPLDKEHSKKRGGSTSDSGTVAYEKTGSGSYNLTFRNNTVGAFLFPVSMLDPEDLISYSYVFHLFGSNCENVNKLIFGLGLAIVKNDAYCPTISLIGNIVGHDAGVFSLGGIFNVTSHDFTGTQISLISNITMNDFKGAQLGLITNVIGHNATGAQISGIINIASQDFLGTQIAGIANVNRNDFSGMQVASICNVNTGNFSGLQASYILNYNYGSTKGVQASVINYAGSQNGLQVGVINIDNEAHGLQIGVINLSNSNDGIPIGLLTFSRSGTYHISTWGDNSGTVYSGVTHYNNHVFNTYGVGYDPIMKKPSTGFGIGTYTRIGNFAAMLDINSFDTINDIVVRSSARLKLHYYFTDRLSLFAGASFNHVWRHDPDTDVATPYGYEYRESSSKKHMAWPGFFFGIEI